MKTGRFFPGSSVSSGNICRLQVRIRGAVQGVGFRPFLYRLAVGMNLAGSVRNDPDGVLVEVEGRRARVERFIEELHGQPPPLARICSVETAEVEPLGQKGFQVEASVSGSFPSVLALPDLATCPDCVRELYDPGDRRYLYPFINCTNCGPRFSIILSLPYDRTRTTMSSFPLCGDCRREYEDPGNRRFHAQPIACPRCGPRLELWDRTGKPLASGHDALLQAADAVRRGAVLALKGIGGFQLIVNALDEEAVLRLRMRKGRPEKPLALMFPRLDSVLAQCVVTGPEREALTSVEAPIVVLRRREPVMGDGSARRRDSDLAPSVSPANPTLGVMLPYSPLHHLLLRELGFPVVATSGNLSEEPIAKDEEEALKRLGPVADCYLVHNRPIARRVDDSVVRVIAGEKVVIRRARGYAPLPLEVGNVSGERLAVGAGQKVVVGFHRGRQAYLSQHVGDLESEEALTAFQEAVRGLQELYRFSPREVCCDLHPDYPSTRWAERSGLLPVPVQHHFAHVLACMGENRLRGPVLGVAWDGTGYGPDGTIWGGEFLVVRPGRYKRVGKLRPFPLPGGEAAVREPRRSALGMSKEAGLEAASLARSIGWAPFTGEELRVLGRLMEARQSCPFTSSMGRLFDGFSSILGLCQRASFEGQGAVALENVAAARCGSYSFRVDCGGEIIVADWRPVLVAAIKDLEEGVGVGVVAGRFHQGLAEMAAAVAERVGLTRVVLTGGCFQNALLTELVMGELKRRGFEGYRHRVFPPNDGSIALGQLLAVVAEKG